jgi:hypothetical protein
MALSAALRTVLFVPAQVVSGGGGTPATFVSADARHIATGGANFALSTMPTSPLTVANGDLALVAVTGGSSSGTTSVTRPGNANVACTSIYLDTIYNNGTNVSSLFLCPINSADITSGLTVNTADTGNVTSVTVFRGTTTTGVKTTTSTNSTTTLALGGLALAANSAGVSMIYLDNIDLVTPDVLTFSGNTFTNILALRPWSTVAYAAFRSAVGYGNTPTTASFTAPNYATATNKVGWAVELLP